MKTNTLRSRILVMLLALLMVFTYMPTSAFADGEAGGTEGSTPVTVNVDFTSQAYNAFLHAPQFNVPVSSDLAEKYGFTDDLQGGVSALDVLIRAHEITFGSDFTPETVGNYITGGASYITGAFEGLTNLSFAVNGECPNDGVWNDQYKAYTGYAINQAKINNGDNVEFLIYQDSYWLDNYPKLTLESDTVSIGKKIDATVEGWSYAFYGCAKPETIAEKTEPVGDAQIAFADLETGALTDIDGAVTDENGKVTFKVPEKAGEYYITAYVPSEEIEENYATPLFMSLHKITVTEPSNLKITVPDFAELTFEQKDYSGYNYKPFTLLQAIEVKDNGNGTKTYYYSPENNKEYYYTVKGTECVTYKGFEKYSSSKGLSIEVSDSMLKPEGKTSKTLDRDYMSNSKNNVADVYMNINEKGFLNMEVSETKQLVCERIWQAVNTTTSNVYVEPDFHYSVIDFNGNASDVVSVSDTGVLKAEKEGTAVVLVTYDAMNYAQGAGGTFYGAIWPENTGVFVVAVGGADSDIDTNMLINEGRNPADTSAGKMAGDVIDAEHDIVYFVGESGEFTFTPESGCSVEVANPVVTDALSYTGLKSVNQNADGSFDIPLSQGRNIVKISKNGHATYQVISAKQVSYTINNGDPVRPGDNISIKFDTLYHPTNKLAGIYNMTAYATYLDEDGKLVGGAAGQYNFASNEKSQTVANYLTEGLQWGAKTLKAGAALKADKDTIRLTNGCIVSLGWGDPFGNHRGITLEEGKAPNLNAVGKEGYFGILPDIEIKVETSELELVSISGSLADGLQLFAGDKLNYSDFIIKGHYDDQSELEVSNFTFTPEVVSVEDEEITITYQDKTAKIPITVSPVTISSLEITTAPSKTTYTEGEFFNPSGMVVTALYNNGNRAEITDYAYDTNALTTNDTAVTIKVGEGNSQVTVQQAIIVNAKPETPSETKDIKVSFTLLGDGRHDSDSDGNVHTLKAGNLTTWIAKTEMSVPEGSTVLSTVEKALSMKGMGFRNTSGNYISEINGLAEFDNGQNSGWMYTLNGRYPSLGVAEQKLNNGDVIVFHYTDDWSKEAGMEQWNPGGGGGTVTPADPTKPENPDDKEDVTTGEDETQDNPEFETSGSNANIISGVQDTKLVARSKAVTMKDGRDAIKVTWTKTPGYKMDYFEIYRSTERYSGYGKTPIFKTKDGSTYQYYNTKGLKPGTTYYYKVRGVREINGKKYYTDYSLKAIRTVE